MTALELPDPVDRRASTTRALFGHGGVLESVTPRAWSTITGITLHQTACVLGERPGRWDGVGAHVGITRGGTRLWLHELDARVVHGNGWNTQCVGIEVDGLFEGILGDPATLWDDPSTKAREVGMRVTPEQIAATRDAIRWICQRVEEHGGKVRALVAHRQSSESRRNDPGSEIWQTVAIPMHAELGLHDGGPGFHLGDGRAIPEAWDPTRVGVRY